MNQGIHTGLVLGNYELVITVSPRGPGLAVEDKTVTVKAYGRTPQESEEDFKKRLLEAAINISMAFAQGKVSSYMKKH